MSEAAQFTIEQFYRFIAEKKIMAVKCENCGKILIPPRPLCPNCLSTSLKWIQLKGRGKLLTYTVIHVAPEKFQHLVPYIFGIVELDEGVRLPGIIQGVKPEDLKIGMTLEIDFKVDIPQTWPQWPRYFFKPP
ncbi:Zn-ribbon domain-containing OB-fold protein [Candidatus Bathyarchaeota archaeon]|nr:Zn-ribbon domain-containing OB-fold protein [Candidatus Bathyarchaeota archaeon]